MQINIKQLETGSHGEEKSLAFSFELNLSGVNLWGQAPFRKLIPVTGDVKSHLGIVTVAYKAIVTRDDLCARCLKPIHMEEELAFSHTVLERDRQNELSDEEDDNFILLTDGVLDLDELVTTDMLLEQDHVALCAPDCKGICPKCGIDRNEAACLCDAEDSGDKKEPDTRFAALLQFMEENKD